MVQRRKKSKLAFFKIAWQTLKLVYKASRFYTLSLGATRIVQGIIPAGYLYVGKLIIDSIVQAIREGSGTAALPKILSLVAIEGALIILEDLLTRLAMYCEEILMYYLDLYLSTIVSQKAGSLDLSFFDNPKFYDKLQKIDQDINWRPYNLTYLTFEIINETTTIVSLLGVIARFHPLFVIVLIVTAGPLFWFRTKISGELYYIRNWQTPKSKAFRYFNQMMRRKDEAKEVKLFELSDYIIRKIRNLAKEFLRESQRVYKKENIGQFFFNTVSLTGYYGTYIFIIFQALIQKITIGDLTLYSQSFSRARGALGSLIFNFARVFEHSLFLDHFFDFMALEPKIVPQKFAHKIPLQKVPEVRFENVYFRYPRQKDYTLKNINLTIKPGEKIALVGENGAGKTTLIKVLTRLYEKHKGKIYIDGAQIEKVNLSSLYRQFGVIFQDFAKFFATASENIAFGNLSQAKNSKKIAESAKISGASDFIEKLPKKYKTMLGSFFWGGHDISTGQWQKIALARSLFKDAPVMILDEPTASMDPKSEYEFFEKFLKLAREKTVILISHRFSTVRLADKIYVVEEGKITEEGSHEELLKKRGTYANLFRLQAKGYQ
jgi:ATP-binding cassette subfamily B protein